MNAVHNMSVSVRQTTLLGEVFEVKVRGVDGGGESECDERCLRAQGDECRCRCGGRNHGVLRLDRNATLDNSQISVWLGHIKEIWHKFEGRKCVCCGTPFTPGDIMGYPHSDGIYVDNYKMNMWVYGHCHKCGYDTAWWKVSNR